MENARERARRYFAAVARGMGPADVRQANQRAVLAVVSTQPGCSNAEIARLTGLAPQSVSAVLDDLERLGLLMRGPARRSGGRGQPATPLFIAPDGAFAIGAEIGWTHLDVVLVDVGTHILDVLRVNYAYPDAATLFGQLARLAGQLARKVPDRSRIVGLGLTVPDGLGRADALLPRPAGEAERWSRIDLVAEARRATGLEVEVMNDGNACCWAEFVAMPSPRSGNFAHLFVGTFLEAGIVSEDRLWEGAAGGSANLGSMRIIDRQGRQDFARRVASLYVLGQRLAAAGFAPAAYCEPDPPAGIQAVIDEWIEDCAHSLAQCILNAHAVLSFDFAVLDSELPEPILLALIDATRRHLEALPSFGPVRPDLRRGHLGRSGAAQGAAFMTIHRKFFSRELPHLEG